MKYAKYFIYNQPFVNKCSAPAASINHRFKNIKKK